MGVFDNVNTSTNVEKEADRVKGQRQAPMDSDVMNLIIKHAYVQKSKGGAMGVFISFETAEKREIRFREYVTSGDAKGNKSYYEKKQDDGSMKQFALPGFSIVESLCKLITDKGIFAQTDEKRTIKLYDHKAGGEVPTEVDMLTELVGKPVAACVLHQIQDKTKLNEQSGKYEPTGQTFGTNVIDKFLHPNTRKTSAEQAEGVDAAFVDQWTEKWKGQIDDQSTTVKDAGMKGAPTASGEDAPKAPLFG